MLKKRWWIVPVAAAAVVVGYFAWPRDYCRSARSRYGLRLPECPDGVLRQRLHIEGSGLHRGGPGEVRLSAAALYTVASADDWREAPIDSFDVALSLVDAAGQATPLAPERGWRREGGQRRAEIVLPQVADGDYLLRAEVASRVGKDRIDLPLALYAPARVHVLTDRPLYEPGNEVRFRAVVLRANDLGPIDGRPGKWVVRDPYGDTLLEEKAPAGAWGVVAGSFPLDREAPIGDYQVSWVSAADQDTVTFRVEPFTLPRFRVEASPDLPFYRSGDRPRVSGAVTYSSGAPVAGAAVEVAWSIDSDRWPPPTDWTQGGLPTRATAGPDGRFALTLPAVPADLQGQASLRAVLSAVDAAGDRVEGGTAVLLSEDAIQAEAITELAGGLVEGFNNRVYLRVTTADGRPLPGAEVTVQRAWAANDKGITAALDVDGVARVQLDPGPPVNVVIPALPYRPAPRGRSVDRLTASDLVSRADASLADRIEMDRWLAPIEACAKWVTDSAQTADLLLRVDERGAIVAADTAPGPQLDRCVLGVIEKRRLPPGRARVLWTRYQLRAPDSPELLPELVAPLGAPPGLEQRVADAARDARDCLPPTVDEGELPWAVAWQIAVGATRPTFAWMRDPARGAVAPALVGCVDSRLARVVLDRPAEDRQIGFVRLRIAIPDQVKELRPQPTILQGYELLVSAALEGREVGRTRLRMTPGEVPELRLRATPVLAAVRDEVAIELIRGPSFSGELPEEIQVEHLGKVEALKVDPKSRTARFTVGPGGDGWYQITALGARTLVYARAASDLAVSVLPERSSYPPGADARLAVQTDIGGRGAPAAVGLFGVDDSLSQLVALPGPDDLGRVRPPIAMIDDAFGVLDGQALVLGRIRGPSAAEATILRVASIPTPAEIDVQVHGAADTLIDPIAELTDRFYVVLEELHAQVRSWEAAAPADELMRPPTMARLWSRALDACRARGERIDDAFGRRLRLHRLPPDLLELTDPRQVVVVGTRLPEDVENRSEWVTRSKP